MLNQKPKQRGSESASAIYRNLRAKQAKAADDGIKLVKQSRERPISRGLILDASTATLLALLEKPNLDPGIREGIQIELNHRQDSANWDDALEGPNS